MLKINTDTYKIDTKFYENEIGVRGFDIYIDLALFVKRMLEANATVLTLEDELSSLIGYYSAGAYYGCSKELLCKTLIYMGVPDYLIAKKGKYIFNLDNTMPSIINFCERRYCINPTLSTNTLLLCKSYEKLSKAKVYSNSMNQIKERLNTSNYVDSYNNKLATISSMYTKKVTGRYYTDNYNIQGWNKASVDCFTVPKDYFLVWADFSQIDFRVACNMLLLKDNDDLKDMFNKVEDKYEGFVRMLYKSSGKEFNYNEFLANRPGFKTSVLAAMYGAGENTIAKSFKDPKCAKMLLDFFDNNDSRNNYIQRLSDALNYRGEVQCIDYFGQVNRVPVSQSDNSALKSHELKSINNNSIQSTSNSIIMTWCIEVTKRFRDLGFEHNMFKAYLNRHDEMLFMCHKSVIPHLWILKDYSELSIDDWSVLTVEPSFGYHYKTPDEELEKEFLKSCKNNESKIKPYEKGEPRKSPYIHCKKCIKLYSLAPVIPSEFIFYCLSTNDFFKPHIDEIVSKHKSDIKSAIKYSQELLREFINDKENSKSNTIHYELCLGYRLFSNNYYYIDESENTQMITQSNLLKFLKDNDYGYVTIVNYAKSDYILIDDIQIRYVKEGYYPDITSKIPGYYDEVRC